MGTTTNGLAESSTVKRRSDPFSSREGPDRLTAEQFATLAADDEISETRGFA
jgi:hypothetical protein